jgi:hypothetical protein
MAILSKDGFHRPEPGLPPVVAQENTLDKVAEGKRARNRKRFGRRGKICQGKVSQGRPNPASGTMI